MAKCPETEETDYSRLLDIAEAIGEKIADDTAGSHCGELACLELDNINLSPVYSIFGGWSGWSLEIQFVA